MILITLYKDLTGIGYNNFQKDVLKWVKISLESLQHNIMLFNINYQNEQQLF
jgi:hypothetical protein